MQKKTSVSVSSNVSRLFLSAAVVAVAFISGCNSSGDGNGLYNPRNPLGLGPAPVSLASNGSSSVDPNDLGSAANYVILAKTGVSNNTGSTVTGNIGVSPVAATAITGFALVADATNVFSTSAKVTGKVYAANYAVPTPSNLTTAISNMETAYTDAAGRTTPDFIELGTGNLAGLTLTPGLYKWSTSVNIPSSFTIAGSATDVWIFQIAGNVTMAAAQSINLSGGALAKNIFWQVAGSVSVDANSAFQGNILGKTSITFLSGASLSGRALAQTAVVMDNNVITRP